MTRFSPIKHRTDLAERRKRGQMVKSHPLVPATAISASVALMMVVMIYGPGLGLGLGTAAGSVGVDTAATAAVAAPNTPTVAATVFAPTGDSARVTSSAFVGSGGDTHDSTIWQVDTINGDWTAPHWADSSGASLVTDTATGLDSAGVFKVRAQYGGTLSASMSAWSDSITFTMTTDLSITSWVADWANGVGTADTALRATNTAEGVGIDPGFGGYTGSATPVLEVKATASTGNCSGESWPGTNQLGIYIDDDFSSGSRMVQAINVVDTMSVGGYQYWRFYDCLDAGNSDSNNGHLVHLGTNNTTASGSDDYGSRFFDQDGTGSDGSYTMGIGLEFNTSGVGRGQGEFREQSPSKTFTGSMYRRELRAHRFHTDSVRWQYRIYNGADSLIATGADHTCRASDNGGCAFTDGGASRSPAGFNVDTIGQYAIEVPDFGTYRSIEIGNNGRTANDFNDAWWYWACARTTVTTASDGWIGAGTCGG